MRTLPIFFFFALFMVAACVSNAQHSDMDSLKKAIPGMADDTNKVMAMYHLAGDLANSDTRSALDYAQQALDLATALNFKKGKASSLNNLGIIYESSGEYEKAADFFLQSLKLKEEIGNKRSLANTYANLGEIFDIQGSYDKAISYYNDALQIGIAEKDTFSLISSYLNLGVVESEKGNNAEAFRLNRLSAALSIAVGDSMNLDDALNNIGVMHENNRDYDSALYYYGLATIVRERTGDLYGMLTSYNNIASVNIQRKNYSEAEIWLKKSIELQAKVKSLSSLQTSYHGLADIYDSTGRYDLALEYTRKYEAVHDSLFSLRSSKAIASMELKYQQEKKEKEDKIRKEAEERERRLVLWFLIAITLLVSGFSLFLFNRFRVIRRQKVLIEVKNKEITDSINYAKRLQEAILPPKKMIREILPDHFILYRPKDIVAGDFYWVMQNGKDLFFAVADCTGHGVPGAMVSFICSTALDRAVIEFDLKDPGKILDKVTELVLETFSKSEEEVKDGMDISICHFSRNNAPLSFAGANNSCWIVRGSEVMTLDADSQPVGKHDHSKPFTTHHFELQKGDCVYLGTDGYSDQFGGPKGKKFKTANLRNLLAKNSSRPMPDQLDQLALTFDEWKGNLEQVDDVCVMGVRF